MSGRQALVLWDRWIDLWNGQLEQARGIIHPDFIVHRIPRPRVSNELVGREALLAWITQTHSLFDGFRLTVEVG